MWEGLLLTIISGCLFHFGQCIWRHIQDCGLTKKYHDDNDFHLNVKKLIALAFVPLVDVIKAYELLKMNLKMTQTSLCIILKKHGFGNGKSEVHCKKKRCFTEP